MSQDRTDRRSPPGSIGTPTRAPRQAPTYRPVRSPLMSMGPSLEDERRRHRMARLIAVASVVVVAAIVLLVWLIGLLGKEVVTPDVGVGSAVSGTATGATAAVEKTGKPNPQTLAAAVMDKGEASIRLQLPIRREAVTGIGFGPRHQSGVIELKPSGTRANTSWMQRTTQRFLSTTPASDLRWYRLDEGDPSMVVVGALPGTEVYAPIDGMVAAITPYELDGEQRGHLIQLQPTGDGRTILVVRNIDVDADLQVGTSISQGDTRLGTVRDMEGTIEAPLAAYTHDTGSGVDMYLLRIEGVSDSRLG